MPRSLNAFSEAVTLYYGTVPFNVVPFTKDIHLIYLENTQCPKFPYIIRERCRSFFK